MRLSAGRRCNPSGGRAGPRGRGARVVQALDLEPQPARDRVVRRVVARLGGRGEPDAEALLAARHGDLKLAATARLRAAHAVQRAVRAAVQHEGHGEAAAAPVVGARGLLVAAFRLPPKTRIEKKDCFCDWRYRVKGVIIFLAVVIIVRILRNDAPEQPVLVMFLFRMEK